MTLARNRGMLREQYHRKKIYCPHCGKVVNHIEIRTDEEAYEFRINFENGAYAEEAAESLRHCEEEIGL